MTNTQNDDDQTTDVMISGSAVTPTTDDASASNDQPIQSTLAVSGAPDMAEDADLIEKEWVHKAKEIVENTKSNPYAQSEQMQHIRADYIRKRYGKDVQANE